MTKKIRLYQPFGDLGCQRPGEKIEENPQKPEYILTVWGAGYKFADKP